MDHSKTDTNRGHKSIVLDGYIYKYCGTFISLMINIEDFHLGNFYICNKILVQRKKDNRTLFATMYACSEATKCLGGSF